jgi:hypothetical protein
MLISIKALGLLSIRQYVAIATLALIVGTILAARTLQLHSARASSLLFSNRHAQLHVFGLCVFKSIAGDLVGALKCVAETKACWSRCYFESFSVFR